MQGGDSLDNPAFANSKAQVASVLTSEYLLADRIESLDLFDREIGPTDVVKQTREFLKARADLTDVIFYYCGHGHLSDQRLVLCLGGTDSEIIEFTGLRVGALRASLRDALTGKRTFLILDCCYAGAAMTEWMSGGKPGDQVAHAAQKMNSDVKGSFPKRGTAVMAAASKTEAAIAPSGREMTLFSGHLCDAIRSGLKGSQSELSFRALADEVTDRIQGDPSPQTAQPWIWGDAQRVAIVRNRAYQPEKPPEPLPPPPPRPPELTTPRGWGGYTVTVRPTIGHGLSPSQTGSAPAGRDERTSRGADAPRANSEAVASASAQRDDASRSEDSAAAPSLPPPGSRPRSGRWPHARAVALLGAVLLVTLLGVGVMMVTGGFRTSPGPDVATGPSVPPGSSVPPGPSVADKGSLPGVVSPSTKETPAARPPGTGTVVAPLPPKPDVKSVETATDARVCGTQVAGLQSIHRSGGLLTPVSIVPAVPGFSMSPIRSLAFSPDRRQNLFATASDDGAVRIWDAVSFKVERSLSPTHVGRANSVAFSDDGSLMASAGWDGIVYVWRTATRELIHTLRSNARVKLYSVAFAPGGPSKFINAGGDDGVVYIWNLESPSNDPRTSRVFDDAVHSISFARGTSGEYVAAGLDGQVTFIYFDRGRQSKPVPAHTKALRVAYSPDGRRLASSGTGSENVKLWDSARRAVDRGLPGHNSYATAIAWSSNGQQLVSGGGGEDNTVKIWNVSSGQMAQEFPGHLKQRGLPKDVEGVAFHPTGNRVVSVGEDGMLKLWQVGRQQELLTAIPFNAAEFLTFAGGGCYAASPGVDRGLRVRLEGRETAITGDLRRALHVPEGFGYVLRAP